jgi:FlaA1/EpsC-like NDP-sugar epimerase
MRRRLRSATFPLHRHSLPQLVVDAGLVALAYYLAFWLRFDQSLSGHGAYEQLLTSTLPWVVVGTAAILALSRVYQRRWRYVGQRDIELLVRALIIDTVLLVSIVALAHPVLLYKDGGESAVALPAGVVVYYFLLALVFLTAARVLARAVNDRRLPGLRARADERSVLIVGAGQGGRLVCLDEAEPDEVIIAIPSAPGELRGRVVTACRERGIPVRTLPTVFEMLAGSVNVARAVRDVQVEDVLGREPVHMELGQVGLYLAGAVVAVTGAGGSIGSELCRQISRSGARRLILLDHAEDNMFNILRELEEDRHVHPSALAPVLADCKEEERMREVLSEERPSIVFHAAAYKHVGLMERNPVEAIRNNAIGTRVVATVAGQLGLDAFVLVSTDKAVMPATVMGASKALAECAIDAAQRKFPETRYMAVRFGNVLGSSGSVVPIFRRQIAAGGPVTVTDRGMTRYFMTIPEAVALVIRAGSLGTGGEVFVLDMGEPVSIIELATKMIELSGLRPEVDIAIELIGRRPGEKLKEDLFNPYEQAMPTTAEKIWLAQRDTMDIERVEAIFDEISLLVLEADAAGLAEKVAQLTELRVQSPVVAESS